MAAPPFDCDNECHAKRVHLYMFYSIFLASLLLLALVHFVLFLSNRRKAKFEAREYASRKLEFVTFGISDLLPPNDKETGGQDDNKPTTTSDNSTQGINQSSILMSPEPSTSSSFSAYNRVLTMNGTGGSFLKRLEESSVIPRMATPVNHTGSSSSSATSTIRGRSILGALQEPVIVTVATVSALFQQHDITTPIEEQSSRPPSAESISSVLDISDLVNSPGKSIAPTTTGGDEKPDKDKRQERRYPPEGEPGGGLSGRGQMLGVCIGGGRGGLHRPLREELQMRKEDLSAEAIFPASDSPGGIYDINHVSKK